MSNPIRYIRMLLVMVALAAATPAIAQSVGITGLAVLLKGNGHGHPRGWLQRAGPAMLLGSAGIAGLGTVLFVRRRRQPRSTQDPSAPRG
jgi:hypothetical protein